MFQNEHFGMPKTTPESSTMSKKKKAAKTNH